MCNDRAGENVLRHIENIINKYPLLLIAGLGLLAYINAFSGGFMFDDYAYFDHKFKNLDVGYQFTLNTGQTKDLEGARAFMWYRPVGNLLLVLEYFLFGQHTFYYHVFGLILWIMAAWCVFHLVKRLLNDQRLALLTATLYSVHPINGIVVNYITASVYALQVIVMVACMWIFLDQESPVSLRITTHIVRIPRIALGLMLMMMALLIHETSLLLPCYLIALCLLLKRPLKYCWPWVVCAGIYFIWRLCYASLTSYTVARIDLFHMSIVEYLATIAKLFTWYITCLVKASGMVVLHSVEVVRTEVWQWLGVGSMCVTVMVFLFFKLKSLSARLGFYFLMIGFLIVPVAALLQPINGMMIEPHWFVFSSIGFFLMVAVLIARLGRWQQVAWLTIILLWIFNSWGMNFLWANEKRYGNYWHQQSPAFISLAFHMGQMYDRAHDYTNMRYYFEIALKHHYHPELIYPSLGWMCLQHGDFKSAERYLIGAVYNNPKDFHMWTNLGVVFERIGKPIDARNAYTMALRSNPHFLPAQKNMERLKHEGE